MSIHGKSYPFTVSANLSIMYQEVDFLDRFELAAKDTFNFVEFWPTDDVGKGLEAAKAQGLQLALLNVPTGGPTHHGRMAHPDATAWWRAAFLTTFSQLVEAGTKNLTLIVGNKQPSVSLSEHRRTIVDNLAYALDTVADHDVTLLIEPLNPEDRPDHLVRNVEDAFELFEEMGNPGQLRLLFDVYHLGQSGENIAQLFRDAQPLVGYVQVADSPGRHQPGTGEIDFVAFFAALVDLKYDGFVGLEFEPSGSTESALDEFAKVVSQAMNRKSNGEKYGELF